MVSHGIAVYAHVMYLSASYMVTFSVLYCVVLLCDVVLCCVMLYESRYSELQRDMQRRLEEMTSKDALAEDLQRRLDQQEDSTRSQLEALSTRLATITSTLEETQQQASSELKEQNEISAVNLASEQLKRQEERAEHTVVVAELQQRLEVTAEESNALREEMAVLEERVEAGLGSKKTLEDYKQRAQKAVKQVHTHTHTHPFLPLSPTSSVSPLCLSSLLRGSALLLPFFPTSQNCFSIFTFRLDILCVSNTIG